MKIRFKLVLYFGILLVLCFSVAVGLTRIFLKNAINRLIYSNVVEMNETIANSLDGTSAETLLTDLETVQGVTGVQIIVFADEAIIFSTFAENPDFQTAYLASEAYHVYLVRHENQIYYYTAQPIANSTFTVWIFRGENLALQDDLIYYAGFIGVIFLIFSVTTVSFFTTRSFTSPIRELAGYANRLNPEVRPEPRPEFNTLEFNELGTALEKASIRLYDYHQSEQEFLHNFSHEMKSPLTNIYGYAEAMYYHVLSEEENRNACKVIMNESEKLKDTINQILLLGRLDAIHHLYQFQKVNLVDVIGDAMNSALMAAKEAGIELRFENAEETHYLAADSEKMETAFVNILTNGIRYAKTNVTIRITQTAETIQILFDDDGEGIAEAEREKVFERYYTGKKGHTGLGLTITKAVVQGHNGTIRIDANDLAGARFILTFPRKANVDKIVSEKQTSEPIVKKEKKKK
jgi:signal transduction histidine kinase